MLAFFHRSDLDGFCSGAIVRYKYPGCRMFPIEYGDTIPWEQIRKGETVFMCDFSFSKEDMLRLMNLTDGNFYWYDHHDTSIKDVNSIGLQIPGIRNILCSGCELTWMGLFPNEKIPECVFLIGRYDVWDLEDKRVLPFQYRMRMEKLNPNYQETIDIWTALFEGTCLDSYLKDGEIIYQYQVQQDRKYAHELSFETVLYCPTPSRQHIRYFIPYTGIAVNRAHVQSSIFDGIHDPSKHDLMITFCRMRNQKWMVRLYSDNVIGYHCGDIAIAVAGDDGGGHEHAAGFTSKTLPFQI